MIPEQVSEDRALGPEHRTRIKGHTSLHRRYVKFRRPMQGHGRRTGRQGWAPRGEEMTEEEEDRAGACGLPTNCL